MASPLRRRVTPKTRVAGPLRRADRGTRRYGSGLRARLRLSQPVFARALNVSPETIRAWEQGKRRPDGAALRLLQVAERHPEAIVEHVGRRTA